MTLELIAFVASIVFGILWYWRESNGNKVYRFFNKLINSKKLQMRATDKTGFVFQQKFLLRLVFVTILFLIVILVLRFLIPIDYATVSMFASSIVGTLTGTYLGTLVFKSSEIITKKSDVIEDTVNSTIDKGRDFIDDVIHKNKEVKKEEPKEKPKEQEKSARDRLKEKGLL